MNKSLTINLTIPGEPISGSQLKFNRHTGHAYRPTQHQQRVFTIYEYAKRALEYEEQPWAGNGIPLAMQVNFYFPYRKVDYGTGKNSEKLKPSAPVYVIGNKDIDNLLKPLKDGLKGVVYADDNQLVLYESVTKLYSKSPRTEITIRRL